MFSSQGAVPLNRLLRRSGVPEHTGSVPLKRGWRFPHAYRQGPPRRRKVNRKRKPILLRLDPAVHDALGRWASDEFRSLNAQIEVLLRRALTDAGRMPRHAAPLPRRGRPLAADRELAGEEVDS